MCCCCCYVMYSFCFVVLHFKYRVKGWSHNKDRTSYLNKQLLVIEKVLSVCHGSVQLLLPSMHFRMEVMNILRLRNLACMLICIQFWGGLKHGAQLSIYDIICICGPWFKDSDMARYDPHSVTNSVCEVNMVRNWLFLCTVGHSK